MNDHICKILPKWGENETGCVSVAKDGNAGRQG